jgi:hypothetical protein
LAYLFAIHKCLPVPLINDANRADFMKDQRDGLDPLMPDPRPGFWTPPLSPFEFAFGSAVGAAEFVPPSTGPTAPGELVA